LHAEWHGYTPTDLVFPFFLFIVGVSIVFAYPHKTMNAKVLKKLSIRSLKLIGLGLFLGAFTLSFPFFKDVAEIRFPGVLQRIGVVFFFTSVLFLNTNWRSLVVISIVLLLGYWILLEFVPVNGMASTLERAPHNLANFVDVKVFGNHNYKPDYDPEGLLSTLPSIATCLFGIFTGLILTSKQEKKTRLLVGIGGSMLLIGSLWDIFFPINKALWTSSFVLVTAGWANILLALIYYGTDVKKIKFGKIFCYAGTNAITLYFLSSFIQKILNSLMVTDTTSVHEWLYQNIFVQEVISLEASSLLYAIVVVAFYLVLAYIMYQKKIFIKV